MAMITRAAPINIAFIITTTTTIIRPHRSTTYVDAAYCYRPCSVVCLSVCHTSEPCKNGWTDRDTVLVEDSGGPRNHVLDGVQIPPSPVRRGNFGEYDWTVHMRRRCGLLSNYSDHLLLLWRIIAPCLRPRLHSVVTTLIHVVGHVTSMNMQCHVSWSSCLYVFCIVFVDKYENDTTIRRRRIDWM